MQAEGQEPQEVGPAHQALEAAPLVEPQQDGQQT
jgi:hypothetical protein